MPRAIDESKRKRPAYIVHYTEWEQKIPRDAPAAAALLTASIAARLPVALKYSTAREAQQLLTPSVSLPVSPRPHTGGAPIDHVAGRRQPQGERSQLVWIGSWGGHLVARRRG
jgi:hypothetical protein